MICRNAVGGVAPFGASVALERMFEEPPPQGSTPEYSYGREVQRAGEVWDY